MAVGGMLWNFVLLPHFRDVNSPQMTQIATCVMVFMLTGILGCLVRLLLTAREFAALRELKDAAPEEAQQWRRAWDEARRLLAALAGKR